MGLPPKFCASVESSFQSHCQDEEESVTWCFYAAGNTVSACNLQSKWHPAYQMLSCASCPQPSVFGTHFLPAFPSWGSLASLAIETLKIFWGATECLNELTLDQVFAEAFSPSLSSCFGSWPFPLSGYIFPASIAHLFKGSPRHLTALSVYGRECAGGRALRITIA